MIIKDKDKMENKKLIRGLFGDIRKIMISKHKVYCLRVGGKCSKLV